MLGSSSSSSTCLVDSVCRVLLCGPGPADGHGLVAVANDGVHFESHSAFNAEYGDVGWFKPQAARIRDVNGYSFVMNHGTSGDVTGPDDPAKSLPYSQGCPSGTSQCLRFLKSKDALHWKYMYTSHPNISLGYAAKGQVSTSRWDDAYMTEDTSRGGYVAFGTGTPTAGPGASVLRSADGLTWLPAAPIVAHFSDVNVEATRFEVGGVEKMPDGRFYMLIGGSGPRDAHDSYSAWTLRTNGSDIAGPYSPDPKAYRVSGQSKGATKAFGQVGPVRQIESARVVVCLFASPDDVD